ncbi:MAG: ubiquitin-like small modifier protein 1 [Candidatus Thorarchaeota archaeon]
MKVTVKFYSYLRDLIGKKTMIELDLDEGAIISQLLNRLFLDPQIKDALLDDNQELKSDITLLKNGREITFLDGMETKLEPGDEISVFPLVAGG